VTQFDPQVFLPFALPLGYAYLVFRKTLLLGKILLARGLQRCGFHIKRSELETGDIQIETKRTIGPYDIFRSSSKRLWFNEPLQFIPMSEKGCISVSGFGHSGSSAVHDFLMEFRGNTRASNSEFVLIRDYGGLQDLSTFWQGRLLQNSHLSIDMFKRLFYLQHRHGGLPFFGHATKYGLGTGEIPTSILENFIDSLKLTSYPGLWVVDPRERLGSSAMRAFRLRFGLSHVTLLDPKVDFNKQTEHFLRALREEYIQDLNYQYAIYDHAVHPTNLEMPRAWFSNLRTIVVTRDPRDQLLSWRSSLKGYVPTDVVGFCKYYKSEMEQIRSTSDSNLVVRFEDFVLNHDQESRRILDFIGLSKEEHLRPEWLFKREFSASRVGKWKHHTDPDIEYISQELAEYCIET
jgi:hypothetical protein